MIAAWTVRPRLDARLFAWTLGPLHGLAYLSPAKTWVGSASPCHGKLHTESRTCTVCYQRWNPRSAPTAAFPGAVFSHSASMGDILQSDNYREWVDLLCSYAFEPLPATIMASELTARLGDLIDAYDAFLTERPLPLPQGEKSYDAIEASALSHWRHTWPALNAICTDLCRS